MAEDRATPTKGNILIVDDAPNNLRLLARMLEEQGYGVRTVISGAHALTSVSIEAPDLVLLDIAMPEMNGYEVCTHLQANAETRDIPIIFISALDDAVDKVRAFEVGGVDYINKPFHMQEVLARVHTHLTLRNAQRQLTQQNHQLQQEIAERTSAEEQLRMLSHRLVEVQENERAALARELHDGIGQVLTGLSLSLEVAASGPAEQRASRLHQAQTLLNDLIQQIREMSMHLRPPMLDDLGILPALFWYFERYTAQTNIQVTCRHTDMDKRFAPDIEITIYRIIQEALTNIARYAKVPEAVVHLRAYPDQITIQVEDQGIGFAAEAVSHAAAATGLVTIRERIHLLGGNMAIDSSPSYGTCLLVELPLMQATAVSS